MAEEGGRRERPQKAGRKMETLTSDASAMREILFSDRHDARPPLSIHSATLSLPPFIGELRRSL